MGRIAEKIGNEMANSIAKIIRDDGRCPKNLQIDIGKEFYNTNVQKLLKKHNKSLFNIFHNEGICRERFNRILKNDMWRQFTYIGNYS